MIESIAVQFYLLHYFDCFHYCGFPFLLCFELYITYTFDHGPHQKLMLAT